MKRSLEICRWLNIAPHKLKVGNANCSNLQQRSIDMSGFNIAVDHRFEQNFKKSFNVKGSVIRKIQRKIVVRE
jgi:hypothetical protein